MEEVLHKRKNIFLRILTTSIFPEGKLCHTFVYHHLKRSPNGTSFDARVQWPECPSMRNIQDQANCGEWNFVLFWSCLLLMKYWNTIFQSLTWRNELPMDALILIGEYRVVGSISIVVGELQTLSTAPLKTLKLKGVAPQQMKNLYCPRNLAAA